MKKILIGLYLLIFILSKNSVAKEKDSEIYCLNKFSNTVYSIFINSETLKKQKYQTNDRCHTNYLSNEFVEVSKRLYEIIKYEQDSWDEKGSRIKETTFWGKKIYYSDDPNFDQDKNGTLEKLVRSNMDEIINFTKINEQKLKIEEAERQKQIFVVLEKSYGKNCTKFQRNSNEFNNCLLEQDNIIKAAERKQLEIAKAKKKVIEDKQKELDTKLAKMTPVERREYNCEKTFQFRKGSDKFRDCVFKLYTTELELQKLELEKQVALAKLEAENAKARAAASEQSRADAVANAQIAAANAQRAAAKSASLASSLSLMQLGSSMMSSPAPAPSSPGMDRIRTTCRNVGGFINCY